MSGKLACELLMHCGTAALRCLRLMSSCGREGKAEGKRQGLLPGPGVRPTASSSSWRGQMLPSHLPTPQRAGGHSCLTLTFLDSETFVARSGPCTAFRGRGQT